MKQTLIILTASLFISFTSVGQNLFYFLADSYPSSAKVELKSNAGTENLNIFFTKDALAYPDSENKYMVLSVMTEDKKQIEGEIHVYFDNGDVLLLEPSYQDYMDNTSYSMYQLYDDELAQLKSASISTIQYTTVSKASSKDGSPSGEEDKYSATINGYSTQGLVVKFFGKSLEFVQPDKK